MSEATNDKPVEPTVIQRLQTKLNADSDSLLESELIEVERRWKTELRPYDAGKIRIEGYITGTSTKSTMDLDVYTVLVQVRKELLRLNLNKRRQSHTEAFITRLSKLDDELDEVRSIAENATQGH